MRRLNPTVKFITLSVIALIVSFQTNLVLNMSFIGVSFITLIIYWPLRKVISLLSLLTLSAVGVFYTGLLFYRDNQIGVSNVQASYYAWHLVSRVYCFGLLGSSFVSTTSLIDLIYSLQQQLGLPQFFAFGLLASFHMGPIITKEYHNILYSLKSRGIAVHSFSLKLLTPLLVKSIRWSQQLAIAMASHGFSSDDPRTYSQSFEVRRYDFILCGFALGLAIVLSIFGS